jgi:Helix-turn-helix domain
LALTLVDVVTTPARLAEASAEEVACLYGAVEAMRARIAARPPNADAMTPSARAPAREYLTLKDLAGYCAIGTRRLRDHLTDAEHPLPHFRVGGKILVRRSDFDAWIGAYRRIGAPDVERIVREVISAIHP